LRRLGTAFKAVGGLLLEVFDDGLGAGVDVEFVVDALEVFADGVEADGEEFGDFLVEATAGEMVQDLEFAGGELFEFGSEAGLLVEELDHFTGDVAGHRGAALVHIAHGLEELAGGGAFEEITAGAGGEGLKDALAVVIDGEHEELEPGMGGLELAHAVDAVHAGQVDVHEHDVGEESREFLQGFFGGRMAADDREAGGGVDHEGQVVADVIVVLDDRDAQGTGIKGRIGHAESWECDG